MLQRVVFYSALSQVSFLDFIGQIDGKTWSTERQNLLSSFIYAFRYANEKKSVFFYDYYFITDSWNEVIQFPYSASVH